LTSSVYQDSPDYDDSLPPAIISYPGGGFTVIDATFSIFSVVFNYSGDNITGSLLYSEASTVNFWV